MMMWTKPSLSLFFLKDLKKDDLILLSFFKGMYKRRKKRMMDLLGFRSGVARLPTSLRWALLVFV